MRLALAYTLFAVIATAANLGTQAVAGWINPDFHSYWVALVAGTGVGLVVKYLLDKQYIFRAGHITQAAEVGRSFAQYAASGLLTTAIFWGCQTAFHHFVPLPGAKYVGGAIGLAIGYVWKYRLDKRFAFATPATS